MEQVQSLEEVRNTITNHSLCILYFTGSDCGACEVIKQKLDSMLISYPQVKKVEVNGVRFPLIAANYNVYSLPLILLFVEEKESIRVGRNLDLLEFERKLSRYIEMIKTK